MVFKKWSSIDNHYQNKTIDRFMRFNTDLLKETYIITEKIDGANFSITFDPNEKEVTYYKRSGAAGENFYDYQEVVNTPDMNEFKDIAMGIAMRLGVTLQFVGELFGPGIQKRVNYGDQKQWKWYGVIRHDEDGPKHIPPIETHEWFLRDKGITLEEMVCALNFHVPILAFLDAKGNIHEVLENTEHLIQQNSRFTPKDFEGKNVMEGAVVRPYNHNFFYGDSMFILKVKNVEFRDNENKTKPKVYKPDSEALKTALAIGYMYVNENRTADLFSKIGPIEETKQLGQYIHAYFEDFFTDFVKDGHGSVLNALEKADRKAFNKRMNTVIVEELKRNL